MGAEALKACEKSLDLRVKIEATQDDYAAKLMKQRDEARADNGSNLGGSIVDKAVWGTAGAAAFIVLYHLLGGQFK